MSIAPKSDLSSTYGDEAKEYRELSELGNQRTSSGAATFTSATSSITYDTVSGGEDDVLSQLYTALTDSILIASEINTIITSDGAQTITAVKTFTAIPIFPTDTITEDNIIDDAVTTDKVKDANITLPKMATDSVDTSQYVDGSISYVKFDSDVQDLINLIEITEQTGTSYTTDLADAGTLIDLNNAAAIDLTIPLNASVAYDIGAWIAFEQTGAGQVTIVPTGGVTINAPNGSDKIASQYGRCVIIKKATDTWSLGGWITS